jgi:hypothetical protein
MASSAASIAGPPAKCGIRSSHVSATNTVPLVTAGRVRMESANQAIDRKGCSETDR